MNKKLLAVIIAVLLCAVVAGAYVSINANERAVVATPEPTQEPTPEPTAEPTAAPTEEPTAAPTEEPTAEPTEEPTAAPTEEPTAAPTEVPTPEPTEVPTPEPTDEPVAKYVIPAGDVTRYAISDAYGYGLQINVTAGFGVGDSGVLSSRLQRLESLLSRAQVALSFYDDFGTARIRGNLLLDGKCLIKADMQIFEDGSVQCMTSLTGDALLMLPAGTVTLDGINLDRLAGLDGYIGIDTEEFKALSPFQRLRITFEDLQMTLLSHLLGWISGVQHETNELYVMDYEPREATNERDAVSQSMVVTVTGWDFCELFFNIMRTVRDERGPLQYAIADCLAQMGVTRYQVRQIVDRLMTVEMDPAEDWVQPSASILNDGTLCQFDDVAYAVKKLCKSVDRVLGNSTLEKMTMVISYDDYNDVCGLDADVPVFSDVVPYEGFFHYNVKTDEHEQRTRTAHGELQVLDGNRVVGDMTARQGQDVDGVKASSLQGVLDVNNQEQNTSLGFGVDTGLTFRTDGGDKAETIDAQMALNLRNGGAQMGVVSMSLNGETAVEDDFGFTMAAQAEANVMGLVSVTSDIAVQTVQFDEEPVPTGTPVDLTDTAVRAQIKQEVVDQLREMLNQL